MRKISKLIGLGLALTMLGGVLAGCSSGSAQGAETGASTKTEDTVKVGMIALGFGTQSFNDDVLAGITLAEEKYGIEAMPLEVAEVSDVANSLRTLISQGCELLVVSTSEYKDGMIEVAQEFPEIKFLYLSEVIEGYDNIMSTEYKENEGSFLAGVLAGLLTETNKVGAILAIEEPLQSRYKSGYTAGVKAVNPDAEVQTAFTNSYQDVGKGSEVAKVMYSKGVDFIGTYAAACNLGVFQAAAEAGEGRYAFGAANGQFDKMPDKILASVVKPIDQAISDIIGEMLEGNFDTSQPKSLGIKENGVTLKFTDNEALLSIISEENMAIFNEIREMVINREIIVPETDEEVKNFTYTYSK